MAQSNYASDDGLGCGCGCGGNCGGGLSEYIPGGDDRGTEENPITTTDVGDTKTAKDAVKEAGKYINNEIPLTYKLSAATLVGAVIAWKFKGS